MMTPTLKEILRDSGEIDYDRADPRDIPACTLTYSLEDQDPDAAMYAPRRAPEGHASEGCAQVSTIDAFLRRARAEYLRREPIEAERTAALDLARLLGDAIRSEGTESEIREAEDALTAAIERRRA